MRFAYRITRPAGQHSVVRRRLRTERALCFSGYRGLIVINIPKKNLLRLFPPPSLPCVLLSRLTTSVRPKNKYRTRVVNTSCGIVRITPIERKSGRYVITVIYFECVKSILFSRNISLFTREIVRLIRWFSRLCARLISLYTLIRPLNNNVSYCRIHDYRIATKLRITGYFFSFKSWNCVLETTRIPLVLTLRTSRIQQVILNCSEKILN